MNDAVIKLPIYLNLYLRIVEHIINVIQNLFHVFIQDRGAYKYKNARFVSLHIFPG
jgi:hypothetical protein